MEFKESKTVELKQIVVDDIKKEMIAFANSDGGTLYIGVADNGEVIGVSNPAETILRVNNMIRDSIKPDLTLFTDCEERVIGKKSIVAVTVQRGTDRPYYIAGKGIRPEGVYIRHGEASVPATDTSIRRMIRETDGENYEDLRSLMQELTFGTAKFEFERRNMDFGDIQMQTLGILNEDSIYTNLGLLLSEQCSHTIKAAVFQDETQNIFKDRHEFRGSLFKQLNDVYEFIDIRNQTHASFEKLLRIDVRDYPEIALREALLNSIVHREYALGGSILIKIFSDRIEFISVGGLVRGIELEDIMSGYSICRNPKLAAVFYRLKLIEAYGTGMQKIFSAYQGSGKEPNLEATPNVFKLILPNRNVQPRLKKENEKGIDPKEKIIAIAKENGYIDRKSIEQVLNISQSYAGRLLAEIVAEGKLVKKGRGKSTKYYF